MKNTDMRLSGTLTSPVELGGHLTNQTLQGLSAYEVAIANGFTGTETEWLASLKGETGKTPNIQVGNVSTGQHGTNASATMTGTKENPVLNITIPRGDIGATPNIAVGTVATGEEGTQAQATITGTPENPVLNLTIPKGDTGNDGFDPIVEVTKSGDTATLTVIDSTHTNEVNIVDGYTPRKNVDYFDGHSPVITASKSQGNTFIYSDGERIATIVDGDDGYTPRKNVDYFDGHTPVIGAEKIGDTTVIYVDGTRIATVLDGLDGNTPTITAVKSNKTTSILADGVVIGTIQDGTDGHTPVITTSKSGKTNTILADGSAVGIVSDGADGHSPEITTSKDGKTLTIMSDGQSIGTVQDGADAIPPMITTTKSGKTTTILSDGKSIGTIVDGNDGISSNVTVSKSGNTTTVYVNGTASAQIQDGADGHTPVITASKSGVNNFIYSDGNLITTINDGAVGRTPTITAIKSDGITTISSDGVSIATINDGAKGDPGQDGVSPSATVTQTANGATITITDKTGTTTANVANGEQGRPGQDGHTPVKGTDYWTQADQTAIVNDVLASQEISDIESTLNNKVDKEAGKGLSTNDYTTTEKNKLANTVQQLDELNQDITNLSEVVAGKYAKPSTGIPASDLASGVIPDVTGKADKVINATLGNFASLDSNGNLIDSGHKHSDYLTQHQDISGKADKVQNATSGNFASLDANGNLTDSGHKHSDYLTEHQDLTDYVKTNDYAGVDTSGVVMLDAGGGYGIYMTSGHYLRIYQASDTDIKNGASAYRPITATKQHQSVFYGLAKAAGDITQSASSNAVGNYTEEAKAKIRDMLGIGSSITLAKGTEDEVTVTAAQLKALLSLLT